MSVSMTRWPGPPVAAVERRTIRRDACRVSASDVERRRSRRHGAGPGTSASVDAIAVAAARPLVTSTRTLQSRRMCATCSALSSGLTGTKTAPATRRRTLVATVSNALFEIEGDALAARRRRAPAVPLRTGRSAVASPVYDNVTALECQRGRIAVRALPSAAATGARGKSWVVGRSVASDREGRPGMGGGYDKLDDQSNKNTILSKCLRERAWRR